MKITFVLSTVERVGGVRAVFEYADRLLKKGHRVSIVYPAVNLAYLKRASFGELVGWFLTSLTCYIKNATREECPKPFKTASRLTKIPFLYSRFIDVAEKKIPDADIVVATTSETAYAVNALSDSKGQKCYFVQSYEIWDLWNDTQCWKEAKKLRRGDEKCSLAMAAVVPKKKNFKESKASVDRSYHLPLRKITIAEWLRRLIEDKFGERVDGVIPNGINLEIFFKEGNSREESKQINVLIPYWPAELKGFKDGVDAFGRIRARHPNAHFAAYGRKPLANISELRKLRKLPKWIEFHDIKSDAQLRALYNETHVFVSPSWIEGFALPPMEAMACGCAVVTTDASGFADYLTNGETALVVPIKDPNALAQSVCRLIEDAGERQRVAGNGYELVKHFSWEDATAKLEAILKNVNERASVP